MDLKKIVSILKKADTKKKIKFIILFGSVSRNEQTPLSDIDIAVYYDASAEERFKFQIQAGGQLPNKVDFHIFQDLPLALQNEVITGTTLYCSNFQFMFDKVMSVIHDYSSFEKYLNEYYHSLEVQILGT